MKKFDANKFLQIIKSKNSKDQYDNYIPNILNKVFDWKKNLRNKYMCPKNFGSLHKYFKNQYLLEGDWDKLTTGEASEEADDIIELIKSAYAYIGGHSNFKDVGDIDKEAARGAEYEVIDLDDDGDIFCTPSKHGDYMVDGFYSTKFIKND